MVRSAAIIAVPLPRKASTPIYVDTAIRRWKVLTGGRASYAASGPPL
jgi:hypothetical protein